MTLETKEIKRFRQDVKRLKKQGKDLSKLIKLVNILCEKRPLSEKYRDHQLVGEYIGFRECHIEPDWLLIYKLDLENGFLLLHRTGTHSDLFS